MLAIRRTVLVSFALLSLIALSYFPVLVFHLHINPVYQDSGLATGMLEGITRGLTVIDPNAGTTTQTLGHLSADEWLHGRVPWWNPYAGVGLPLAAEMQSESLFVPFVFLLHPSNGVLYLRIVLQVLAGTGTFLLLMHLGMRQTAAFLGAVFYAFNGTFAWFAHGIIMPLAFLPFFLLGIERALAAAKQKTRGGWAVIAIALAYSIYAGFPETAFMDGLLALLWAVVRLVTAPPAARKSFFAKVFVGGIAGLLLTAPLVVPFFEYLKHSAVSHNDFGNRGIPESSFLQLFLPYIYGPIEGLTNADSAGELGANWGNIGGYFGITVIFLAAVGIIAERRERVLRILLAAWTVIVVARTISVPGTQALFGLIPGMSLIAVYRNSSGSFEMAAAILAAFAVDRWLREGIAPIKVLSAAIVTALLIFIGYLYGAGMIHRLHAGTAHYPNWLWGSVAFAVLSFVLITMACLRMPTRRAVVFLSSVVIAESICLYAMPMFAGFRGGFIDKAPLAYLQSHIGWQRAYSLGATHPNYGSFYRVPFIDHESLPVSDSWISFVRQNLDPDIDFVTFSGEVPPPFSSRAAALRRNLNYFKQAGVQFVTAPRGTDSLENWIASPHAPSGNIPVYLFEGKQISGTLPSAPLRAIGRANVDIGTDGGASNGMLKVQLCSGTVCVQGSAGVAGALDNAPLPVPFTQALTVDPSQPLRYTLTNIAARHPVAIWMYPALPNSGNATLPDGSTATRTPDISFLAAGDNQDFKAVFQTPTEDIFELLNVPPYFDLQQSPCRLAIESHQLLKSSCTTAATLIRRELFYPGWKAFINGREAPLRATSIFQTVDVPAGESKIEFRYVPTNLAASCSAALLGLAMLLIGYWRKLLPYPSSARPGAFQPPS